MARRKSEELFWHLGGGLHQLTEEIGAQRPKVASGHAWEPRVDIIEEEARFLIKAELPGVIESDIRIQYQPEPHIIAIAGVRHEEDFSEGSRIRIHQLEIFHGEFLREIRLPDIPVDAANIQAKYRNGFLIIAIPKLDRVVFSKTITIRTK